MKTLYVFLLCLYTSLTVAAQPLCQIKHFSVNSGLSQGVVAVSYTHLTLPTTPYV